jgi:2-keto-4-pentenoate hydratase/2-oxohepta-3-ene-1,7-dioic acid hydratase in catechol pathway
LTLFVRYVAAPGEAPAFGILSGDTVSQLDSAPWEDPLVTGQTFALANVTLLAPTSPHTALGVGLNYHAGLQGRDPIDPPALFVKPIASIIGAGEAILLPTGSEKVIPEGEVVAVIGRRLSHVTAAEALQGIFGITAGNDVTAREWLRSPGDWWRAKGSDTFTVLGPAIATDVDLATVSIEVSINGAEVSSGNTDDLIVGIPELVAFVSEYVTLEPGDVIFTGTPGRVQTLNAGDVVDITVGGVGVLSNPVRRAGS